MEFLADICAAVIEAGATTLNIPDTVGYATPKTYGEVFKYLIDHVPAIKARGIILSSHCHNDLGLAVANSLAAAENGALRLSVRSTASESVPAMPRWRRSSWL